MSKVEKRLFWPLISERNSCQSSLGIFKKTSTTAGSNWVPEQRRISSRAAVEVARLAIGAVAGDGVEGVGDGEDAGADGDLAPAQAVGIAVAVEMLLMAKDDLRCSGEEGNLAQHLIAARAVFAHESCSSGVSLPGLRRISSGMAILPTSCRKAPRAMILISSGGMPMARARAMA